MSIYKTIDVTHDVYTTAKETKGYPRIAYDGNEPNFPIGILSRYDSVYISMDDAKELVGRLAIFLSSIADIDKQHDEAVELLRDNYSYPADDNDLMLFED